MDILPRRSEKIFILREKKTEEETDITIRKMPILRIVRHKKLFYEDEFVLTPGFRQIVKQL